MNILEAFRCQARRFNSWHVPPRLGIQFIWWWNPVAWRIGFYPFYGGMAEIYKWALILGPLEIRRWTK